MDDGIMGIEGCDATIGMEGAQVSHEGIHRLSQTENDATAAGFPVLPHVARRRDLLRWTEAGSGQETLRETTGTSPTAKPGVGTTRAFFFQTNAAKVGGIVSDTGTEGPRIGSTDAAGTRVGLETWTMGIRRWQIVVGRRSSQEQTSSRRNHFFLVFVGHVVGGQGGDCRDQFSRGEYESPFERTVGFRQIGQIHVPQDPSEFL
mmetsp:Transcript_22466/g.51782  ORF Transcript_22466/g.51782 Transcript_22466/m.51782 type:complete len:204 (-) Transcript_22466:163-774(-)